MFIDVRILVISVIIQVTFSHSDSKITMNPAEQLEMQDLEIPEFDDNENNPFAAETDPELIFHHQ